VRIRITGGYSAYVSGILTDANGEDLSTITLKLALYADGVQPGVQGSSEWKAPSVTTYPTTGKAKVSLLVHEGDYPVGKYRLWCLAVDSPEAQPVMAGYDLIQLV
jgi:hypothetical protein